MLAEFGIWKIEGAKTTPVTASALANEAVWWMNSQLIEPVVARTTASPTGVVPA